MQHRRMQQAQHTSSLPFSDTTPAPAPAPATAGTSVDAVGVATTAPEATSSSNSTTIAAAADTVKSHVVGSSCLATERAANTSCTQHDGNSMSSSAVSISNSNSNRPSSNAAAWSSSASVARIGFLRAPAVNCADSRCTQIAHHDRCLNNDPVSQSIQMKQRSLITAVQDDPMAMDAANQVTIQQT